MKIVFVCTGNTCRSPMAEAIAKSLAKKYSLEAEIFSAGILVLSEVNASENALKAMSELDLDLTYHVSKQISSQHMESADLILTMTSHHKNFLTREYASHQSKIYTLSEYANCPEKDVADPFGKNLAEYKICADEIHKLLKVVFTRKDMQNYDSSR